ncbi:class I SAM-dependent methyltransferase [Saccharopolyspora hattusasensis]|uniref:class I SAM-dependent methyltransferase n=1 Tax=Saccharopolyspora hattusasensis TaxID=1128679 RepID=UPI003D96C34E
MANRWPTFEGRNSAILLECVRHPRRTGAVASTPLCCAEAFIDRLAIEEARHVVELGAGTGVITSALRHRLPSTALLLSVEISPALATQLRAKHTADNVEVVCGSAAELITILNDRRIPAVDCVISSLPWTLMPIEDQHRILHSISAALADTGCFSLLLAASHTWTTAGRRFDTLLREHFPHIRKERPHWANLPPLRAYHCRLSDR